MAIVEKKTIAELISLLADGLYVWQAADRTGVDRRTVASIKAAYHGRILALQRERAGLMIDGSPKSMAVAVANERIRTFYVGPHMRISLDRRSPDDATIRVALGMEWTDAALIELCRKLSRMSGKRLDALAARIRGEGTR